MNPLVSDLLGAAIIGIGATLIMDFWAFFFAQISRICTAKLLFGGPVVLPYVRGQMATSKYRQVGSNAG